MSNNLAVSVLIVTYNQKEYIKEAINSVVNQKTNFPYEIIVSDDCSTDGTKNIIKEICEKHPTLVRAVFQSKNLGPHKNFQSALSRCQGKYIAILEGDDYWTCQDKLQMQYDLLEKHQELSGCFTRARVLREGESSQEEIFPGKNFDKESYDLSDVVRDFFIPTLTVMYRAKNIKNKLPDFHSIFPNGDWLIHILNAQQGNIGMIRKTTGVYRVHGGGIWSSSKREDILKKSISAAKMVDRYLGGRYKKTIKKNISNWFYEIANLSRNESNFFSSLTYSLKGYFAHPYSIKQLSKAILATLIKYLYFLIFQRSTKKKT